MKKGFTLGKKRDNGIQTSGGNHFVSVEQIFLECRYPNRKKCHDTIALIPLYGFSIDNVTDEEAGEIFANAGWLVKGYNDKKHTRCPYCKTKITPSPI